MEQIPQLLREHFPGLFLLGLFWVIGNCAWRWRNHRRHGITFPPRESVVVLFEEGMATGNSDKSWMSRWSIARQCLRVTVTQEEVWIRAMFPLNLISEADVEHRVPRKQITSATLANPFAKNKVGIVFIASDGRERRLALVLKNPNEFLVALQKQRDTANA